METMCLRIYPKLPPDPIARVDLTLDPSKGSLAMDDRTQVTTRLENTPSIPLHFSCWSWSILGIVSPLIASFSGLEPSKSLHYSMIEERCEGKPRNRGSL